MWTRLLLADPSWQAPRPLLVDNIIWELMPADGYLERKGFGDGSIFHGRHMRLARGGWGLVTYDHNDTQQARLHGPLPGYHQDILLAELYALLMYVRHVGPGGGHFCTDSLALVSMWQKGEAACCRTFSIYASVWTRIWSKVHDVGEALISVAWIKGHTGARQVAAGIVTQLQSTANGAADAQAKLGAAMHADVSGVAATLTARAKALEWTATYVGHAHATLWRAGLRDTTPWQDKRGLQNELTLYRGRAARAKPVTQASHVVANVGSVVFCVKCGCYAERRWRGLAKNCPRVVPAHAAQARTQLLRGCHPRSNRFIALPTTARVLLTSARREADAKKAEAATLHARDRSIDEFGQLLPNVEDAPVAHGAPAAALSAAAAAADTCHLGAKRRLCAKTSAVDAKRHRGGPSAPSG